jgi:predicted lipoprotein with Yx(FWY)xxD motif
MRIASTLLIAALLAFAGCGDDEEGASTSGAAVEETATTAATAEKPQRKPAGAVVALGDSEFGSMLFNAKRQAIYIFERDRRGETVCYGECAEAWPPVYTDGEPVARRGVRQSLLGTVKRRDGRLQVTYAGKPLYLYAHEGPGEVRCHNVNLNGGLWWVVGPDGKRRA